MSITFNKKWGRFTAVLLLSLFGLFVFTSSVAAQGIIYGDIVPPGETVENDVLLNGSELRVDGTVDGDVFAMGRFVTINGKVTGSLFVIGEEVKINGTVEGSVYVVSMSFALNESGKIDNSLYFLGLSLHTQKGSQVGRDLNGLSVGTVHRGSVGRDNNLIVGLFEIGKLVFNAFNDLNTGKNSAATPPPLRVVSASMSQAGGNQVYVGTMRPQAQNTAVNSTIDWINRYVQGLISFLIVGGLAIWLLPQPFASWTDELRERPLPSFAWGLVAYIVGFVGIILLTLVVLAIGFSLGFVSLWGLAFTWLGLALSGMGVAFWTFILFLAFMSKAIIAYVIGAWIFARVYPRAAGRALWPLLLGLLIYTLICMIPYLGWAFGFIVTCLGLGAVWQVLRRRGQGDDEGETERFPMPAAATR